MYCVTNKRLKFLESSNYNLSWVGLEECPENYIKSNAKINIFQKEKYYSELTFHYWYWKNLLDLNSNNWIGFCQKRRFWSNNKINENKNLSSLNIKQNIIMEPSNEWKDYEAILCEPININNAKKIKMIKRGFKTLIKKPSIFFDSNKQSIKFHFDMHHGYGNLDKAIDLLGDDDKKDFRNFVNNNTNFNPHIMFISKPKIINQWFIKLFQWLENCEKIFGFEKLSGYDTQRLYAYLAERYLSYWFKKNYKVLNWPWVFFEEERMSKN